jgi:hypothetical protein
MSAWLTAAITIVGSGLGTSFVGLLFKRKFDHDLEIQRAFLTRASRVHDRQVDSLIELYGHFYDAHSILTRMTATGRLAVEKPEKYPVRLNESLIAAYKVKGWRLLIPRELVEQCDKFFKLVLDIEIDLSIAEHPMIADAEQSAKFWDSAKATAYEKLPALLEQIENAARSEIHGK